MLSLPFVLGIGSDWYHSIANVSYVKRRTFAGAVQMALMKGTQEDVMLYAVPVMLNTVWVAEECCHYRVG